MPFHILQELEAHLKNASFGAKDTAVFVNTNEAVATSNNRDLPFAAAIAKFGYSVAIKARTQAVKLVLSHLFVARELGPYDISTPIVESFDTLHEAFAYGAAVVREDKVLVVWSDKKEDIINEFRHREHRLQHLTGLCTCGAIPRRPLLDVANCGEQVASSSTHPASGVYDGLFDKALQERLSDKTPSSSKLAVRESTTYRALSWNAPPNAHRRIMGEDDPEIVPSRTSRKNAARSTHPSKRKRGQVEVLEATSAVSSSPRAMGKNQITAIHSEAAPDEDTNSGSGNQKIKMHACPVHDAGPSHARSDLAPRVQTERLSSPKPGTLEKEKEREVSLAGVPPQPTEGRQPSPPGLTATDKGKGRAVDSPDGGGGAEPGPSTNMRERTQSTRKSKRKVNAHDDDPYADAADQRRLKRQKQASMTSASGSTVRCICTHPGCQKTYGREKDMVRHRKTHDAPTNFCGWCGKGFGRLDVLRRHCRERHEDILDEQDEAVVEGDDENKDDGGEECSWMKSEEI
ncbi:predicted protein [Postia placenta Mad-698-R]|nr:predicted protein [Postia placenta Mad-698-R]